MEWLSGIKPEGWAAVVAAAIAALSFLSQARSQRQQTRLALLEHRFRVFTAVRDVVSAGERLMIECGMPHPPDPTSPIWVELREATVRLQKDRLYAPLLYGREIVAFTVDVLLASSAATALATRKRYGTASSRDRELLRARFVELEALTTEAFRPYLGRERHAGVSWLYRLELQAALRRDRRDPLLRPSQPLNQPGQPTKRTGTDVADDPD